jgi:hypothetical protein
MCGTKSDTRLMRNEVEEDLRPSRGHHERQVTPSDFYS